MGEYDWYSPNLFVRKLREVDGEAIQEIYRNRARPEIPY